MDAGRVINVPQMLKNLGLDLLKVLLCVHVLHVCCRNLEPVVWTKVLEIVIVRQGFKLSF